MGAIEKTDGTYIYRQDDGEITACFTSIEEPQELSHKGSPGYRRVFNLLVLAGLLYLAFIFLRL